MIIWGSKGITGTTEQGTFNCPVCQGSQPFEQKRVRKFFTLYFIPLFPTSTLGEYVECGRCQGTFAPEVRNYDPQQDSRAAEALFMTAVKSIMIHICLADGEVDPEEVAQIQMIYEQLTGIQISSSHRVDGRAEHLTSIAVPNSDLVVMQARQSPKASILSTDLPALLVIFLATCILVGMFINAVLKQLRSMIAIQRNTEVSQQRFQAAAEGDRGGVWEIDLAEDQAYISASLSGVLGLPYQENHMQVSQFLNLFHPADRERFLALVRRSHIQGEFELDIRVAHLPLIMQCRGRPSTRSGEVIKRVIVGVALDITEQRGAQTRLRAAEGRLSDALRSMSDSFVVWDGMKIYCSELSTSCPQSWQDL